MLRDRFPHLVWPMLRQACLVLCIVALASTGARAAGDVSAVDPSVDPRYAVEAARGDDRASLHATFETDSPVSDPRRFLDGGVRSVEVGAAWSLDVTLDAAGLPESLQPAQLS